MVYIHYVPTSSRPVNIQSLDIRLCCILFTLFYFPIKKKKKNNFFNSYTPWKFSEQSIFSRKEIKRLSSPMKSKKTMAHFCNVCYKSFCIIMYINDDAPPLSRMMKLQLETRCACYSHCKEFAIDVIAPAEPEG